MAKRTGFHKVELWLRDEDYDYISGYAAGLGSNVSDECRVAIYQKFPHLYERAERRAKEALEKALEKRRFDLWQGTHS